MYLSENERIDEAVKRLVSAGEGLDAAILEGLRVRKQRYKDAIEAIEKTQLIITGMVSMMDILG